MRRARWSSVFISLCALSVSFSPGTGESASPSELPPASVWKEGGSCAQCEPLSEGVRREMVDKCPHVGPTILRGFYPRLGLQAGNYTQVEAKSEEDCALRCCQSSADCNIAFVAKGVCYLLLCGDMDACTPIPTDATNAKVNQVFNVSMISVRVPKGVSSPSAEEVSSPLASWNATTFTNVTCEVGVGTNCLANQDCVQVYSRNRNGVCACRSNFVVGKDGVCVGVGTKASEKVTASPFENKAAEQDIIAGSTLSPVASDLTEVTEKVPANPVKTLAVSVVSKNVTLPVNEVSLFAYAVPEAPAETPYSYKWSLISHPSDDSALMEGQQTQQLHLMNLKPGTYIFEVTVKSGEGNGSANATIDVFAEKRLNHAPVAIISPANQVIHLPTKSAVLDASLSTDDAKIVSYQWELQKGPVDYFFNPTKVANSTTLQVENLTPGNYTFRLTVEDGEHIKNWTTANITVIKETDYPPTANAGKDIVIYLPQTEVTLNGNASTDDKKIVEWEWKATGDLNRAADMQDTHTPYLKLSHLQVGLYQFELQVTDEAGQSATSTVHVIVKPSTGNPPKADAGAEQTIVLPQNWALLDASGSGSDSSKLVRYTWTQLTGPSNSTIRSVPEKDGSTSPKANATGLTKGDYEFQIEVEDEAKLTNKSSVKITVMQRINDPPKADAGGDVTVTLPVSVVHLNGSGSKDDVKIVEWLWTREPGSLAAGSMLEPSQTSSVLQLTDLVAGRYVFKLTVKDEQGLQDEDQVTLTVREDVHKSDLIEIILDVRIDALSTSDRDKIVQQMTLLLHDVKLVLRSMKQQLHTENAVLIIYGQNAKGDVLNGSTLARQLRTRFHQDDGLLQFPIVSVDTVLCLDQCSGHGLCQDRPDGRKCLCSAFWMENFLKRRYGNGERNCDWSKIYVGVVACLLLMMIIALSWSLIFIFQRNLRSLKASGKSGASSGGRENNGKRYHHHHGKKNQQYTLLDDDEDEEIELGPHEEYESDDDSDSDILFESSSNKRNKGKKPVCLPMNGFKVSPSSQGQSSSSLQNGGAPRINGILKNTRRVLA